MYTDTHYLTRAALYSPNGEVLRESIFRGFGLPVDEPYAQLPDLTAELLAYSDGGVSAVCVNLGGKNEEQLRNVIKDTFPDADIVIIRESAGVIMNEIRVSEHADAILLAGTGAIALAEGPRGYFVCDGWGAELGDSGSGYWIGREALRTALRQLEDGEELSNLTRGITGLTSAFCPKAAADSFVDVRDAVRARLRPLDRAGIARFCKICAEAAREGDEFAAEIFTRAGGLLAETCIRALDRVGAREDASVLVIGGLTGCTGLWRRGFDEKLAHIRPRTKWRAAIMELTKGAYNYYRNHIEGA